MDFRQLVIESFDRITASGEIEKCIDKALTTTIAKVIDNEFCSYGDFGKQIGEAVKRSLALNGDLDLPSYNEQILKIVRRQVEAYTRDTIQKQVAANLTRLLEPPPEEITLEQLVEAYKEQLRDHEAAGCVCYGEEKEIYLLVESSGSILTNYKYIELRHKPRKSDDRFGTKYDIRLSVDGNGKVYSVGFADKDLANEIFAGPFYNFEQMVFQMKAAGTRITELETWRNIDLSYEVEHD